MFVIRNTKYLRAGILVPAYMRIGCVRVVRPSPGPAGRARSWYPNWLNVSAKNWFAKINSRRPAKGYGRGPGTVVPLRACHWPSTTSTTQNKRNSGELGTRNPANPARVAADYSHRVRYLCRRIIRNPRRHGTGAKKHCTHYNILQCHFHFFRFQN